MDPFASFDLDGTLVIHTLETSSYGNNFDGASNPEGDVRLVFESDGSPLLLEFDTYDVDFGGEVGVILNGEFVGLVSQGVQNGLSENSFILDDDIMIDGYNVVEFYVPTASPSTWGVTNILLSESHELELDAYTMQVVGHEFDGTTDTDGVVNYHFDNFGSDLTLYADGFDIDYDDEVEVFLNGESIGFMTAQKSREENAQVMTSFEISADELIDGHNTISFAQTYDTDWTWGVTQVLLLGPGTHVFPGAFDPEFLGEYVVWQTDENFVLGHVDLDTGVYLGDLHVSTIPPLSEYAVNGPELMMTTEGIVAIGTSDLGLVVITPTEDYVIEGTIGLSLGELPIGIVDGIRFNAITPDWTQNFLIDDGVVTEIDLNGGTIVSWISDSEATVSYVRAGIELFAVYDVETGVLTELIDEAYSNSPSKQDAFTTPEGEQLIAINNGFAHEMWSNTGDGWEMVHTIRSPYEGLNFLLGIQFVTWEGKTYLTGLLANSPSGIFTIPFVYDVETNAWSQLAPPGAYLDPEFVFLNNGDVAVHYFDLIDQVQEFFTISYEDAMANQVRGVFGGPIQFGPQQLVGAIVTTDNTNETELNANAPQAPSMTSQKVAQPPSDAAALLGRADIASMMDGDGFVFTNPSDQKGLAQPTADSNENGLKIEEPFAALTTPMLQFERGVSLPGN